MNNWTWKFAYFPVNLNDQTSIWWEYYEKRYTGNYSSLFNEVEFRFNNLIYRRMERNCYD